VKINNLKLRGWTGIKKGLGLDNLELDLSGLSGLIALSGQNGAGKSTILENLQPYRTLASRSKALPWHVFTRDASKELDFDFQGNNYKTKVLIDADSGRQEGYIWKNGNSEIDGKVRNYDAYIENLFGSKDLFFNSIFCAQNASKLSDLTTGKLKELFAEFLRLDKYIAYEATTKQCISLLSSQGTVYQSQVDNLRDRLSQYGDLKDKLAQAQADLDGANRIHGQAVQTIVEIDADIAKVKEVIAANSAQNARLKDFNTRITTTEQAIQTGLKAYEDSVEGMRTEVRNAKQEIVKFSEIIKDKDRIEKAVIERKELAERIEANSESLTAAYTEKEALQKQIQQIKDRLQKEIVEHPDKKKIPLLKEQIRNLKAQTSDLEKRDPECVSTICGFIKTALDAEKSLPELNNKLDNILTSVADTDAENIEIEAELNREMKDAKGMETAVSIEISTIQNVLASIKKQHISLIALADKEGDLREALAKKEAAATREKDLTARGLALKAEYDKKVEGLRNELSDLRSVYHDILSQIDTDAEDRLKRTESGKLTAEKSKHDWEERISDYMATIRTIQDQIAEKFTLEKQLTEIERKGATIQAQVSEWTYMRNALSKDGIRALEIDSVAPSISAYANQILYNTFGPAYSVKLRTQDDEGREVLDILAIEESGKETLLEDLSGGEKCWSLKALRLAMTLIAKQKSGRSLESCFADEEDGALDAENAQNFIRLYQSFMEAGGFDSCFFISHRPECVAMANRILEFGEGGISVN